MEPSKSKNTCICCENSVDTFLGVTLLSIWHTAEIKYPKFISVFVCKIYLKIYHCFVSFSKKVYA